LHICISQLSYLPRCPLALLAPPHHSIALPSYRMHPEGSVSPGSLLVGLDALPQVPLEKKNPGTESLSISPAGLAAPKAS